MSQEILNELDFLRKHYADTMRAAKNMENIIDSNQDTMLSLERQIYKLQSVVRGLETKATFDREQIERLEEENDRLRSLVEKEHDELESNRRLILFKSLERTPSGEIQEQVLPESVRRGDKSTYYFYNKMKPDTPREVLEFRGNVSTNT